MTASASPRQVLLALGDRCGREEPSRALDAAIENALAGGSSADLAYILSDVEVTTRPPAYTTSLDAAVTLVPEGWHQIIGQNWSAGTWACELRQPNESDPYGTKEACGTARTEAMARVAAALRARAEAL